MLLHRTNTKGAPFTDMVWRQSLHCWVIVSIIKWCNYFSLPKLKGAGDKLWEWTSNFSSYLTGCIITYPYSYNKTQQMWGACTTSPWRQKYQIAGVYESSNWWRHHGNNVPQLLPQTILNILTLLIICFRKLGNAVYIFCNSSPLSIS